MKRELDQKVIDTASGRSVTVEEVSKKLRISWPKAHSILSKLTGEGKLNHERKGRINLYRAAYSNESEMVFHKHPVWVKPKDLHHLAEEIRGYWGSESAQEMVEGERRSS